MFHHFSLKLLTMPATNRDDHLQSQRWEVKRWKRRTKRPNNNMSSGQITEIYRKNSHWTFLNYTWPICGEVSGKVGLADDDDGEMMAWMRNERLESGFQRVWWGIRAVDLDRKLNTLFLWWGQPERKTQLPRKLEFTKEGDEGDDQEEEEEEEAVSIAAESIESGPWCGMRPRKCSRNPVTTPSSFYNFQTCNQRVLIVTG
jgi:hypothetical protein